MSWCDNSTLTFHRFHEHNRFNELNFNVSHRYINKSTDIERQSEYSYILTHMRGAGEYRNSSKCLFVIPSTETWVFMDCSKIFLNATFFCEYSSTQKGHIMRLKVPDNYCRRGWSIYRGSCHALRHLKNVHHITSTQLKSKCKSNGGKIARFYSSSERNMLDGALLYYLRPLF